MVLVAPANSNWRDGFVGSCGSGGFFSSFSVDPLAVTAAAVGRRPPIPLLALGKQARGGEEGEETHHGENAAAINLVSLFRFLDSGLSLQKDEFPKMEASFKKDLPPFFKKGSSFLYPANIEEKRRGGLPACA